MTTTLDAQAVAHYLQGHPEFFEAHSELLLSITVPHSVGGRAVSLVERQVDVLRERNKSLERRFAELVRLGQDNESLTQAMQHWTFDLLRAREAEQLPWLVVEGLTQAFKVPQVALRVWRMADSHRTLPCAAPVDAEIIAATAALQQPYCGPHTQFKAGQWLPHEGTQTRSIALLPLRVPTVAEPFGLLVLGSPDAERFAAGMGTAFLERIAETAAAALSRLLR